MGEERRARQGDGRLRVLVAGADVEGDEPRDVAGQLRASETVDGPDLVDDHSATSDSDAVPARACQDSDPPR